MHGKNKVIRGLSACVTQKFNSYEIIKKSLQKSEKNHFKTLDIVYEPVMNDSPIKCFYTDSLHLVFRSYVDKKKKMENIDFIIPRPDNVTTVAIILPAQKMNSQNT